MMPTFSGAVVAPLEELRLSALLSMGAPNSKPGSAAIPPNNVASGDQTPVGGVAIRDKNGGLHAISLGLAAVVLGDPAGFGGIRRHGSDW